MWTCTKLVQYRQLHRLKWEPVCCVRCVKSVSDMHVAVTKGYSEWRSVYSRYLLKLAFNCSNQIVLYFQMTLGIVKRKRWTGLSLALYLHFIPAISFENACASVGKFFFLCWWEADNWKIRGYCQIAIILIHPVNMLLNSQVQGQGNVFFLIKLSLFLWKSDIFSFLPASSRLQQLFGWSRTNINAVHNMQSTAFILLLLNTMFYLRRPAL